MGNVKSWWMGKEIDGEKLKKVAKEQDESVSKLINNILKLNYDILKEKK